MQIVDVMFAIPVFTFFKKKNTTYIYHVATWGLF